ncbi:hypothetical protein KP509_24G011700 [Ceratopteris richardii]|uniref:Actin-related protein 6 n=1 Tax=Ceratopteris richardii TaxID=49495 RepID=A0A8T2RU59_CERRI|nr:hypothetical protein KP509_24G011700 [Ceratopteris richardii]
MTRLSISSGGGGYPSRPVVLDNGAGWCKAGFAGEEDPVAIVPNCVARPHSGKQRCLVADQVLGCEELQRLGIRRPADRGYLISAELQKEIWDRIFRTLLKVRTSDTPLLLIEPPFAVPSIQKLTDELVFEEFGFCSLFVADAASLTHLYLQHRNPETMLSRSRCSLVIDSGFSFTHVSPVVYNFTCNAAVKRIDLGGKLLTNYLKELVSYRTVNMMDEQWIMEDVKEKLCYCSLDVASDMEIARKAGAENYIQCNYILPDGVHYKKGVVKNPEIVPLAYKHLSTPKKQSDVYSPVLKEEKLPATGTQELTLTNERFLVPEMLFHPADLGMNQAGLAECIVRSVNACHSDLHPLLYSSIILTGGTTKLPGFRERLELELRPHVPAEYGLKIYAVDDPIIAPWRGGSLFAVSENLESCSVTKSEYEELGSLRCRRRFFNC